MANIQLLDEASRSDREWTGVEDWVYWFLQTENQMLSSLQATERKTKINDLLRQLKIFAASERIPNYALGDCGLS